MIAFKGKQLKLGQDEYFINSQRSTKVSLSDGIKRNETVKKIILSNHKETEVIENQLKGNKAKICYDNDDNDETLFAHENVYKTPTKKLVEDQREGNQFESLCNNKLEYKHTLCISTEKGLLIIK